MSAGKAKRAKREDAKRPYIPLSGRLTLNIDEFCGMVGIGRSIFYKAIAAGDLVPCRYGKRVLVTSDEMKRFVKNMPGNRSQPQ